jgi:nucleoside-diphosphate-sugar epimerase
VMLTGATGFVGGAVLTRLAERGDEVAALVRPDPERDAGELADAGAVRIVDGDLARPDALADAAGGAEVAVHLAAVRAADEDELEAVNADGTRAVVEACLAAGVPRLVVASSIAVYGALHRASDWPADEDAPLTGALPYARTKAEAERVVRLAAREDGLEYAILRPSVVYGAGGPALSRLVAQTLRHPLRPPRAGGTVQPLHVDDMAEAILLAADAPRGLRATLNVAGSEHVTSRALVAAIRRARHDPAPPVTLPVLKYDIRRAHAVLGFAPSVGLADGLPELVETPFSFAGSWDHE